MTRKINGIDSVPAFWWKKSNEFIWICIMTWLSKRNDNFFQRKDYIFLSRRSICWSKIACKCCPDWFFLPNHEFKSIWMSHWRPRVTEVAEFWINYKWLKLLRKSGCLQLIQNSAPSVTSELFEFLLQNTNWNKFGGVSCQNTDSYQFIWFYLSKHKLKSIFWIFPVKEQIWF